MLPRKALKKLNYKKNLPKSFFYFYFVIQSSLIMSTENYLNDISEIKQLMNKSSRFISLSGLSGILAGTYALIGAAVAYYLVITSSEGHVILNGSLYKLIILDMILILFFSIVTGFLLSSKKAKENGESMWNSTSKRLISSLLTPLLAGGLYILIILEQQIYGQTGALMLLFYGLALVNASKHTIGDIKYLGYMEIILGLLCALIPGFAFWLWVLGFGILHIIYGSVMYFKYERK